MENKNNVNEVVENAQDNDTKQAEEIDIAKTFAVSTVQNTKAESEANTGDHEGVDDSIKTNEDLLNNFNDGAKNIQSQQDTIGEISESANTNKEKNTTKTCDSKHGQLKVGSNSIEQTIISVDDARKNIESAINYVLEQFNYSDKNMHEKNNINKVNFETFAKDLDFQNVGAINILAKENSEDKSADNSQVTACKKKTKTPICQNKLKPNESVEIGPLNNCEVSAMKSSIKTLDNTNVYDNAYIEVQDRDLLKIGYALNSQLTPILRNHLEPHQEKVVKLTHVRDVLNLFGIHNVEVENYVFENFTKIRNPLLRFWPIEKPTLQDNESECKVLILKLKIQCCCFQHIKLLLDLATNFDTNARLMRVNCVYLKNKISDVIIRFQSHLECKLVHDKLKELNIPDYLLLVAYDKGYEMTNKISVNLLNSPTCYESINDRLPLSLKIVELNAEYMRRAPTLLDKIRKKIAINKDQTSFCDFLTSCTKLRTAIMENKLKQKLSNNAAQLNTFNSEEKIKFNPLDEEECRVVHVSGVCTSIEGDPELNNEDILHRLQSTFTENYEVIKIGKRDLVILCPSYQNAVQVVKLLHNVDFSDHSISAKLDIGLTVSKCVISGPAYYLGSSEDDISKLVRFKDPNINVFSMTPSSDKLSESIEPSDLEKYEINQKYLFNHELNDIPLSSRVVVTNVHPELRRINLHEIFSLAGTIRSLDMSRRSYRNNCQVKHYEARITYDHPLEALQAVSMFHLQNIFNCIVKVKIDTDLKKKVLPFGLVTIGRGLGPNGEPLLNLRAYTEIRKIQKVLHQLGTYERTISLPECPYKYNYEVLSSKSNIPEVFCNESNNKAKHKLETIDLTGPPITGKNKGEIINLETDLNNKECASAPVGDIIIEPEKTIITPQPAKTADNNNFKILEPKKSKSKTLQPIKPLDDNVKKMEPNEMTVAPQPMQPVDNNIDSKRTDTSPPPTKKVKPTPPPATQNPTPQPQPCKPEKDLLTLKVEPSVPTIPPSANQNAEQIKRNTIPAQNVSNKEKQKNNKTVVKPSISNENTVAKSKSAVQVNPQNLQKSPLLPTPSIITIDPFQVHPYSLPVNTNFHNPVPVQAVPNIPFANQFPQNKAGPYAYPGILPVHQPVDPRCHFPVHGNHIPANIPYNLQPDIPPYGFGNKVPPGQMVHYHPEDPGSRLHGDHVAASFTPNINQLNQVPQGLVDPRVHEIDPRSQGHRSSAPADDGLRENRKRRVAEVPSDLLAFSNLPRSVTSLALTKKMLEIGDLVFGKVTSKGEGLVRFKNVEDAIRCIKLFRHSKVDGQIIEVEYV